MDLAGHVSEYFGDTGALMPDYGAGLPMALPGIYIRGGKRNDVEPVDRGRRIRCCFPGHRG